MSKPIEKILTYLASIIILLVGLGTLIINLNLSNYGLQDFDVFKPRTIIVGLFFLIFILSNIVFYLLFLELKNPEKNSVGRLLIQFVLKIIYGTFFLYFLTNGMSYEGVDMQLFSVQIPRYVFLISTIFVLMSIGSIVFVYQDSVFGIRDFINSKIMKPIMYVSIGIVLIFFAFLLSDSKFYSCFRYQLNIGIFVFFSLLLIVGMAKDRNRNVEVPLASFFSTDKESSLLIIDKVYFLLWSIIMFLIILIPYVGNIYPNLDYSYGGGKYINQQFYIENEVISGETIHQSKNYIYLKKDSTIIKYRWEDIDSLKIKYMHLTRGK